MNENVTKFFERYEADAALRDKVAAAEAAYPGSLEIRKAVAEEVLLPIAAEIGFPFTIDDLRAYETKRKFHQSDAENAPLDENAKQRAQLEGVSVLTTSKNAYQVAAEISKLL